MSRSATKRSPRWSSSLAFLLASLAISSPSRAQSSGWEAPARVWADTNLYLDQASPSPEGRRYTYIDQLSGIVRVRDLDSKRSWPVSTAQQPFNGWPWAPIFSADGHRVAYLWVDGASSRFSLRTTPADSIAPRTVFTADTALLWLYLFDWSADGSSMLVRLDKKDQTSQLALVPVNGGAPRILKTFSDWRLASQGRISPDGRFVAYSYPVSKEDGRREIQLISLDEGRESAIIKHIADDCVLGWTPDGSRLLFASERAGTPGVWELPLSKGRVSGQPALLRGDIWRMIADGRATRSGNLFYRVQGGDNDVYLAPWDANTGRLLARPTSVTRRPGAEYGSPAWSSDGRFLSYVTWHGDNGRVGSATITIHSAEKGTNRDIVARVAYLQRTTWAPDGRAIILHASDDKGRQGVQRLDLTTGESHLLVDSTTMLPVMSADGRTAYVGRRAPTDTARQLSHLVAYDVASRTHRPIFTAPPGMRVTTAYGRNEPNGILTRDGKHVVFGVAPVARNGGELWMVPTAGGAARRLFTPPDTNVFTNVRVVGLSTDGASVIFTTRRELGKPALEETTVWRVALADGKPIQLQTPATSHYNSMAVSPDGRRIAFTAGDTGEELWVLRPSANGATKATGSSRR